MEVEWEWINNRKIIKKEGDYYGLFRIWWTICTTIIKS